MHQQVPGRVFISYAHDVEPDESLSRALVAALDAKYDVFVDAHQPRT